MLCYILYITSWQVVNTDNTYKYEYFCKFSTSIWGGVGVGNDEQISSCDAMVFWSGREWVSKWLLLNPNSAIFQLCHGKNTLIFNVIIMNSALYKTNVLNETNNPPVDMSPHSDTLFWFRANQSLLFLLNAVCLSEKQQIVKLVYKGH